jgi:hypothetical protein
MTGSSWTATTGIAALVQWLDGDEENIKVPAFTLRAVD